jgi:hypothetical protein
MQELKYISELGENAVNNFNEKIQQGLLPKNAALEVLNDEYSKLESDIEEFKTNLK